MVYVDVNLDTVQTRETLEARRNARRVRLTRWLIVAGSLVMVVSVLALLYFYIFRK